MEELGAGPGLSPVRVNFSAKLSTAIALLAGRLTPAELEPAWLAANEAEIRALAARVSVRHDPALTAKTLLGTLEAGASPDLGLGDLLRIRRRLADVNMDGANPGPALLRRDPRRPGPAPRPRRLAASTGFAGAPRARSPTSMSPACG